jgi:hypothetical protein
LQLASGSGKRSGEKHQRRPAGECTSYGSLKTEEKIERQCGQHGGRRLRLPLELSVNSQVLRSQSEAISRNVVSFNVSYSLT